MTYSTVTLTGTYLNFDATVSKGTVTIVPSVPYVIDAADNKILSGAVRVTLDATGSFSVVLPATDDVTLNPSGFGYTLLAGEGIDPVSFSLPAAAPTVDVSDITSVSAATFTASASYVPKGELVIDVRDYGALGDGVTDDTAAIQAALNISASNGLRVILPIQNKVYVVTQITMPFRATIEIPAGVVLRRLATSVQTGPMILAQRNHDKIIGGGLIECLNACSSGIVRVERTDGTCEWGRFENVQLTGPGKTVTGSTGLVFSGTSTFQNRASGLTISDVDTGIRLEGGANMNHCTDVTLYNIGTKVYDLSASIECTVIGGSVSSSANVTVFTLSGAATYNRFIGFAAEPGGSATMFSIGASALNNQFIGVVDNISALGTDSGTRTLKLFTSRLTFPAPTTTNSSLELPHGTAPTSPINGAVWTTTAGMFVRINGVTKSINLT